MTRHDPHARSRQLRPPHARTRHALVALAAIGLATACGAAIGASAGSDRPAGADTPRHPVHPLSCDIVVSGPPSMRHFEGRIHSRVAVSGSYRFSVQSRSGGTEIIQSGSFNALPGESRVLGEATLGGDLHGYAASFEVKWNGNTLRCDQPGAPIEI